ncbi:retrovirus-related pol polyprotein from transposon TNT 1-94 [Tanacetum coccineum]
MLPLLSYQKLTNHIDGTTAPSATITSGDQSIPNPAFTTWNDFDQRAVILLNSSLTEEAAAEVLGLTTAHAIWTALETAYSNSSVERIHSLRDSLRNLSKGTSTVSDYGRQFKGICDKLAAIGQPVDEMDKLHWFVCGLGASFETFSTAIRTTKPFTTFRDLLSQAESHEMFLKSLHGSATPPAAFFSQQSGSRSSQGRQQRQQNYSRGGGRASNSNGGRGRGGRRPPHCQLCRTNGHYASSCPSLHTYASNAATSDANLAQAFTSQCHVTQGHPDWYVDSGATAHMTSSPDNVSHSAPHSGNMRVFSDRETKQVIAQGLCEDGLYVLRDTPMALAATVGVSRKASFELWHNRLGHVSFDVISTLNKLGVLDVTSILPKPNICKPCQLSKSQRLPFELNSKRSSYPLDLIHCDLWGPAPVSSDGYLYYVIFVDDYSRFTWFYPLKTKSGFYTVLSAFIKLVQTQLSRKIKVFQSDGGTEFVNHTVRKIFEDNGTLHRLSCPYTPQQNGRAERKHRHLVETGLAMLFHAHVPASYWVDAFSSATYIINRLPTKLLGNHSPFELLYSRAAKLHKFSCFWMSIKTKNNSMVS